MASARALCLLGTMVACTATKPSDSAQDPRSDAGSQPRGSGDDDNNEPTPNRDASTPAEVVRDADLPPECDAARACAEGFTCFEQRCVAIVDRPPSAQAFTAGGGVATSASFRVRVYVGGPQPAGVIRSASHVLTIGPAAGRP